MTEIVHGIYQMQIPIPNNPLGYTNTYLVQGTDGFLLIDAGWHSTEALEAMKKQLADRELRFSDITKIVITHVHPDHFGLVPLLKEHTDAEVKVHSLEQRMMHNRQEAIKNTMDDIEKAFTGNGAPESNRPSFRMPDGPGRQPQPAAPDGYIEDGDVISTGVFDLQVIWTPGHAPGHICLYEPVNKLLFGGDHVLPVITPNISLLPHNGENPLGDFMRSLDKLEKFDVEKVLPAHEFIYDDLQKRIGEIRHHHRQRNLEILETLKKGPRTAYEVSSVITWVPEAGGVKYKDLAPMDQRMALLETLAHLKAMLEDGEVTSSDENGTVWFRIP